MGFLDELGLGDIISSVNEVRDELSGLRDDIISSVTDSTGDITNTIDEIASSISGDDTTTN